MAEKRMFSKKLTNTGRFLRMPVSARLLYYELGMEADDDGVVEAFRVIRAVGVSEDDLNILVAKGFVSILDPEDLVVYITDWKINNSIRSDRYTPSVYKSLLPQSETGDQAAGNSQRAPVPPDSPGDNPAKRRSGPATGVHGGQTPIDEQQASKTDIPNSSDGQSGGRNRSNMPTSDNQTATTRQPSDNQTATTRQPSDGYMSASDLGIDLGSGLGLGLGSGLDSGLGLGSGSGGGEGVEGGRRRNARKNASHSPPLTQPEETPLITIPLNDKSEYPIFQNQVLEWQGLYPGVDVMQQLRAIRGWNLSNPHKRKTKRGVLSHITSWLSKEQNQAGVAWRNQHPDYPSGQGANARNVAGGANIFAERLIRRKESGEL